RPGVAEPPMVVDDVEGEVDDRGGEAGPVRLAHVAVVEVEGAGAEDVRGDVELPAPVGDDGPPEEALGPPVHLAGDRLGDAEEERVAGDGELEVALVVERHGGDLP